MFFSLNIVAHTAILILCSTVCLLIKGHLLSCVCITNCTVLCYIILYCTTLHYTVLAYPTLYYSVLSIIHGNGEAKPVPVAERSKACVYGRSPAGIAGSNPTGGMDGCLLCVLSGRGLCDGLITRPEESYRLWCVLVCDFGTSRVRRLKLIKGCKCRIEKKMVRPRFTGN